MHYYFYSHFTDEKCELQRTCPQPQSQKRAEPKLKMFWLHHLGFLYYTTLLYIGAEFLAA